MADERPAAAEAQPIQAFGGFLKNYALGLAIAVAALPIAALRFDTIPQFESMKSLLAILGSGSSFLLVGVIFARRHTIARLFFPWWRQGEQAVARSTEVRLAARFAWFPIILSLVSLAAIVGYFGSLYKSFETIAYRNAVTDTTATSGSARDVSAAARCRAVPPGAAGQRFDAFVMNFGPPSRVVITCSTTKSDASAPLTVDRSVEFLSGNIIDSMRLRMPAASVPHEIPMNIFFFLAFTTASAAFVLTGLKDYLQKELGFTDKQLIQQQSMQIRQDHVDVEGIPGLVGIVDYTPGYPDLATPSRPLCIWHRRPLIAADFDVMTGKTTVWRHPKEDEQTPEEDCIFSSPLTQSQLERRYRASWEALVRGDAPSAAQVPSAQTTTTSSTGTVQASAVTQAATSVQTQAPSQSTVVTAPAPAGSTEHGPPAPTG